mmetsp:Transcript_13598/g.19586  ORF Transcript_13598/g.19586 Transcript_13598/m.19586 type:complete len:494 (+) Transcript_13598:797-2278(+)|eukprot:CAMPEP_0202446594 /NCGR_PEP_ID=MMETSP1360-20130828/5114_1 /ASSEMBLY_ACC=CAM_ASM_000848 /TAXON_ID=515479 /ORGANISM="Licmophora paradoxa, Strain CCMP2313" /LENGTH=493 /DNA_ID=CAMNT_0049063167 /DNA_START=796 /DNA_END=2277 /DNA_ORIENTATION=+
MQRRDDGGLGKQLVGEKVVVKNRTLYVSKLLGEGGFSYVYLVNDSNGDKNNPEFGVMVLKVTSIHSRDQREIAEKEAKLLSRLSHPSIIKTLDDCYRTPSSQNEGGIFGGIVGVNKESSGNTEQRPQHMILMEHCEGGHALDVCNQLAQSGKKFDLSSLIIAFGQICNAVSYLHAQRPPIVHRDLKPVNFLVKQGAYKLCDFGSAVFGHVELKTQRARQEAEEVIQKTTTQMFRAPEMVDLYMANKLTESTDVWALGCCLYSLAFLQNCFEEGSNLAILSRNFKIPEDNPYGPGLAELIDRMLTVDYKLRADMTEVILCLSAIYSKKPLPPRRNKKSSKPKSGSGNNKKTQKPDIAGSPEELDVAQQRIGAYRTDGQGIQGSKKKPPKKVPVSGKKLNSDSAAARRLRGRQHTSSLSTNDSGGNRSPGGENNPIFQASFSAFNEDAFGGTNGAEFQAFDTGGSGWPNGDGAQAMNEMKLEQGGNPSGSSRREK